MTRERSGEQTRSPVPRFQPSTPVAMGMGPDYKACSSLGGFQGSWTKTDGRTHSCHSPHAPRCRRWDAAGSPDHSWLSTGGSIRTKNGHEGTIAFIIENRGDFSQYGVSQDGWLLSVENLFTVKISKPSVWPHHLDSTLVARSPLSIPLWSRLIHKHACCSFPCLVVGSGSHSTFRAPPAGCDPHNARLVVGGPIRMTYCTVGETRLRLRCTVM